MHDLHDTLFGSYKKKYEKADFKPLANRIYLRLNTLTNLHPSDPMNEQNQCTNSAPTPPSLNQIFKHMYNTSAPPPVSKGRYFRLYFHHRQPTPTTSKQNKTKQNKTNFIRIPSSSSSSSSSSSCTPTLLDLRNLIVYIGNIGRRS